MSEDINAFPQVEYLQPGGAGTSIMTIHGGMSLRDYFAAKAMQGFIATTGVTGGNLPTEDDLARYSYDQADAMMKAREK